MVSLKILKRDKKPIKGHKLKFEKADFVPKIIEIRVRYELRRFVQSNTKD